MSIIMWRRSPISNASALILVAFFLLIGCATPTFAQSLTEGFDTVASNDPIPMPGWVAVNHSKFATKVLWFQGNPTVFPSHMGAPNSYIGANFQATEGVSTINDWLLTPQMNISNGDVISFWTRTVEDNVPPMYPDRLQVRLSTAGASTNVGNGPNEVGDFTTLLLDINPTYAIHGYPELWTQQTITISGLPGPSNGRIAFRYFVENGGPDGKNSNYIGVDTFTFTHGGTTVASHQESDYDGDGRTDLSVVRNTGGGANGQITWFNRQSGTGSLYSAPWGIASDFVAPADYDGDNKTDIAVWRQGAPGVAAFYILYTATATVSIYQFGQTGDNPDVHGDFDGDGRADVAVFRPPTAPGEQAYFFYRGTLNNPGGGVTYVPWGTDGDFPLTGDFDGNGRTDFAVQRDNGGGSARFYILHSDGTMDSVVFGLITDPVAPGDYDGDGSTDLAVVRNNGGSLNWFVRPSSTGTISASPYAVFGTSTDFITQGDYDGDGRTDVAVWRDGVFYWSGSTSGFAAGPWGQSGDYPPANWNTH